MVDLMREETTCLFPSKLKCMEIKTIYNVFNVYGLMKKVADIVFIAILKSSTEGISVMVVGSRFQSLMVRGKKECV